MGAGIDDHGERIDDWDGIEEGLDEDIPNGGDVTEFNVQGAEEKGEAEREGVELEDEERDEKPGRTGGDAVDEGEDDDDAEVDGEVDQGGGGGGNDNDVFRETDFAKEVAAGDDRLNALAGAFGEEVPEDGAGEEVDRVVRDVVTEAEEFGEDDIENGKHEEGAKDGPKITEDRALITQFKVGFD